MKKFIKRVVKVGVFAVLLAFGIKYLQAQGVNGIGGISDTGRQLTLVQTNTPGWQVPGSLWLNINGAGTGTNSLYMQTNTYNTGGSVIISNRISVCWSNCGSASPSYSNVFVGTFYTNAYPAAGWLKITPLN